jgi:hypothetical protein
MIAVGSDRLHTLDDGQKKDNVVLRLAPFGVITGRVRDEEGGPVPHMFVSAMVFSYAARGRILTARASATTDDRGEYRMFEVQPGRYCIGAGPVFARPKSAGDDTSYQTSYFPGVIDPTAATLVELAPGQQLSGINFVLHRAHLTTIRGRLIAPPEAMRPFLQIATFNGLGGAIATRDWPLNRDHSFVVSGLSKGSYELFAGYQIGDRHYAVNLPLELGSEDISGLELRPTPPSSLAGRVRVEGGNVSPSRLQVSLNSGSRTTEAAWVHEDGSFVLPDVTPGAYIVYLNGLDGVYLKAVYWGPGGHGTELVDQHIDLTKPPPANAEFNIVVGADP